MVNDANNVKILTYYEKYEYINNIEIGSIDNTHVRNICQNLFNDNEAFFKCLTEEGGNFSFKPVFSHYKGNNNYIFFSGYIDFCIIQRVSLSFAVFFPDISLIVHRGKKDEKLLSAIEEMINIIEEDFVFLESPRLFLINGYSRPYHYFYDTMQAYKYWNLSIFSKFVDLKESAFLPSTVFVSEEKTQVVEYSQLNNYLLSSNAVGFTASSLPSIKNLNFIESFSDYISSLIDKKYQLPVNMNNNDIIIWIGICQESRIWIEQEAAILKTITKIKSCYKSAFFVFDGLTCPHYLDSEDFIVHKCNKELTLLNSIVEKSGFSKEDYISLIGAKAVEKISISEKITFFISDALTDSIWPATFGKKPGVAYSIDRSRLVHFHPRTTFIPKEVIKEVGDGTESWARAGFSINPDFFSKFVMEQLEKNMI